MKITCQHNEQYTVFTLRGELTAEEVDQFRRTVVEQMDERTHDFVLDMSQVQFIDSRGLETLIWLQDQCLERLGQVRLAACPENIQTILGITRLDARLEAHENTQDAIKSLDA
jgi:anti-anti-sigma factor